MSDPRLWLAVLTALPALVIGASCVRLDVERLRQLAVVSAGIMLLATLAVTATPSLRVLSIRRASS